MKPYSQMTPKVKKERLLAYNKRVRETEDSNKVFTEWQLELEPNLIQFDGHRLKPERLMFGNNPDHT